MTLRRHASRMILLLVTLALTTHAWALDRKKCDVLMSATETKGDGGGSWTLAWSFDGAWAQSWSRKSLGITVDSDYSKSDTAKLDRLRLGFRLLGSDYGKIARKWYPVYLVQTEGDHGFDSMHTLGAAGYRQKRRHGFVELTAGVSKDIRESESWVGDIGAQVGYERKLGPKWSFRTGPEAEFGAVGDVRLREDRLRYSWDVAIDYRASERLGFGYRLWYGNTVPNSRRTQWIGVTYKMK